MRISLLYGNPNLNDRVFLNYLDGLRRALPESHTLDFWDIEKLDIHYCTGCWTCWWKTPGQCVHKDDGPGIFKSVIHADMLILASPMMAGFTSSSLKRICDRLIVLLHPYITFINKECHHWKRYDSYPKIGLLLKKESDTDKEDLHITRNIYDRFAINFHSRILFMDFIEDTAVDQFIEKTVSVQNAISI